MTRSAWITFDGPFDPWAVAPVRHALADHPLLQLDHLRVLAERLHARGQVRTHGGEATAGSSFELAPELFPNAAGALASLADMRAAGAWVSLLNTQTDPEQRTLVDAVLDDVRPTVERVDPGMCYRGGWTFIASPGVVTPFHIDYEHNFILQIHGRKRIYVWDPTDSEVISEEALEQFHTHGSRELIRFDDRFLARAHAFDVEPGMGAFMPCNAPHMVVNGEGVSVTASFTFYTRSTIRRHMLYRGKRRLRRLGLSPAPVGASAASDALLYATMRAYTGSKARVSELLGRPSFRHDISYALHLRA